jgi:hypothetical protein
MDGWMHELLQRSLSAFLYQPPRLYTKLFCLSLCAAIMRMIMRRRSFFVPPPAWLSLTLFARLVMCICVCVFWRRALSHFPRPAATAKDSCVLAPSVYVCADEFALLQHQNLIPQSITPREINFGRFGGRVLFLNYADRVSEFIAARAQRNF